MAKGIDPPIVIFRDFTAGETKTLRLEGEKAAKRAERLLDELRSSVGKLDQIETLSRLAFQFISPLHRFGTADFDPSIHSHELELLQALALSHPRAGHFDQREMNDMIDALLTLVRAHSQADMQKSLGQLSDDAQTNQTEAILHRIRATTHTVRGPRHAYQTRFYLRDLADELDHRFLEILGVSVTDIVDVLDVFAIRAGEKLARLQDRSRPWMACQNGRRLEHFLGANPGHAEHPLVRDLSADMSDERIMATLLAVFEEELRLIFRLDLSDDHPRAEKLRENLARLALGFGDVTADMLPHLQLGNPVRKRPIVDAGDGEFYLFCTQTAFSHFVELVDDLAAASPALKKNCETFKARWLEDKLDTLLRGAFPAGKVMSNAKWTDADGRNGETDAILVIDKTVGLFEAKSGRITAPARRGASERLKREIDALLVEPSRQSARLAALIQTSDQPVALTLQKGSGEIDGAATREIVRVNILFDTLGPLTAGTKRLVDAGFIDASEPMAPSMSIFELETMFDALPDQISRLHYLRRRGEIEQAMLFEADEMDLIAFYLENSFCLKPLEKDEGGFGIYGWSDRLAALYDHEGRRTGRVLTLKQTRFWRDMLTAIEARGDPGWTRFGYRLSNVAYRDQWAVQRTFEGMLKRARRIRPGQAVNSGVHDSGGQDRTVIGLCVGKDVSAFGMEQHSHTAAMEIMDRAQADEAIVLYWDLIDRPAGLRFVASYHR